MQSLDTNRPLPFWAKDILNDLPHLCSYNDIAQVARMNRGSVANLHSEGRAPKGSVLMGKKRLFPRQNVVEWLVELTEANAGQGA